MTAQLIKFETYTDVGEPVQVSLFYDKHDLFCVTVTVGNPEKVSPSYKAGHYPDLLPALDIYKRKKRLWTTKGNWRSEEISRLYDQALEAARAEAKEKKLVNR